MPTTVQLMGAGNPPTTAGLLGNDPVAITATGTTAGAAANINAGNHIQLINGQSSQTGVRFTTGVSIGTPYYLIATGATAPVVYVPSGHTLNGTTDGKVTFSGATGMLIMVRTGLTSWWVSGTATGTVS